MRGDSLRERWDDAKVVAVFVGRAANRVECCGLLLPLSQTAASASTPTPLHLAVCSGGVTTVQSLSDMKSVVATCATGKKQVKKW
jgi:hypothetical protein